VNDRQEHYLRLANKFVDTISSYPSNRFSGKGVVICGGGKYFPSAYVLVHLLRYLGCTLPVQLFRLHGEEMPGGYDRMLRPYGVECTECPEGLGGWESKTYAILESPFEDVLFLDADNLPVSDPSWLLDTVLYRDAGAVFWPDVGSNLKPTDAMWDVFQAPYRDEPRFETGQILINKRRCWQPLNLAHHYNSNSDHYYKFVNGDTGCFQMGWIRLGHTYSLIPYQPTHIHRLWFRQVWTDRTILFEHRAACRKWDYYSRIDRRYTHAPFCARVLRELRYVCGKRALTRRVRPSRFRRRMKKIAAHRLVDREST
jgi:hypothetical protein